MMTPMRRQYLQIKKQFSDAVVFFRLGDFYETFDDDARLVSQVCDITLTSRPVGKDQRVPLAGVPYHSADSYIARLLSAGHKVAIVEQVDGGVSSHLRSEMSRGGGQKLVDEPTPGLVQREVVRIVTPGTVVEPALLDDRRNNYLAAMVREADRSGIAYADLSTGEFAATQLSGAVQLGEEMARLQPAEVLVGRSDDEEVIRAGLPEDTHISRYDAWRFDLDTAHQALLDQFQVATLDGFGMAGKPLAVRAAGALIQYVAETQKGSLSHFRRLIAYSTDGFMTLDAATRRNLELTQTLRGGSVQGSLLGVLDVTVTPMGARRLRSWLQQPLLDVEAINQRLDAVDTLVRNTPVRAELRAALKGMADLERLANRITQGIVRPRELVALAGTLNLIPSLQVLFAKSANTLGSRKATGMPSGLDEVRATLDGCPEVTQLIEQAIADDPPALATATGVIRRGFAADLDQVLTAANDAKVWVANLEQSERRRTGIKGLKVGFNRVFGYYIEVNQGSSSGVPSDYIRKQTLANAERFITPELKEYESLILNAEERQADIEARIYREVCAQLTAEVPRLLANAGALADVDTWAALAEVAVRNRYVRPDVTEDLTIDIVGGRHPVVEGAVASRGLPPFVPNDSRLSEQESILVITGPNMSGKSTYLRQVALIALLAQVGSFVPAERAQVGLVDRIFTRIGAEDIIHAGQSTFMVEMVETANILHHATPRSLLILDEIGRGTSTYDGLSIAWAVVEHIHNSPQLRARTLFATHYHELTELAQLLPRVRNYTVAVAEEGDRVVFLHRIVPGGADRSYGIHVAQLAGLPHPVIHRAEEILADLEREGNRRTPARDQRVGAPVRQLPLFSDEEHPVIVALRQLEVDGLTPLEAISKLYELQKRASRSS
jgi:DNA mismatch repair protein MutS